MPDVCIVEYHTLQFLWPWKLTILKMHHKEPVTHPQEKLPTVTPNEHLLVLQVLLRN